MSGGRSMSHDYHGNTKPNEELLTEKDHLSQHLNYFPGGLK